MKMPRIRHVQRFTDRYGTARYYYRKPGAKRVALPDPMKGLGAFMEAYAAAEAGKRVALRDNWTAGTMGGLMTEYLASADFKGKADASKVLYRHVIKMLRARPSVDMPVRDVRRKHILRLRDELAETPAMANGVVKVVSILMSFAVDREYRDDNPCYKIKPFPSGEWRSWTDEELAAFEKRWPVGTMERFTYALALYTGQRRGDLAAMDFAHRRDGRIRVVQEKTGTELWVPEHSGLTRIIGVSSRHVGPLLHGKRGKRFSAEWLGEWFSEAIEAAGLGEDCVLHGLRKAAARRLAEVGCTAHEIMAITGHKSLSEVERYTRQVSQATTGRAAMDKLEKSGL